MPKLPVISAERMVKVLLHLGFVRRRQTGSHLILRHPTTHQIVPVPMHRGTLKSGTLRSILRQANISVAQMAGLIKK